MADASKNTIDIKDQIVTSKEDGVTVSESDVRDAIEKKLGYKPKGIEVLRYGDNSGHPVFQINTPIYSKEDWVSAYGLDPEKWIITGLEASGWSTPMNITKGGESFPIIVQNQKTGIKATLREPEAIKPHIKPIAGSPLKPRKGNKPRVDRDHEIVAIIPDTQIGFLWDWNRPRGQRAMPLHDRLAMDCVLTWLKHIKPDRIIFLGDWLDLAPFSRWDKTEEMRNTTQAALDEGHWWGREFCKTTTNRNPFDRELAKTDLEAALKNASWHILEGNHDKRLRDQLRKHVLEAVGLRPAHAPSHTLESLGYWLGFEDLGVAWHGDYPNGVYHPDPGKRVAVFHGNKAQSAPGATIPKYLNAGFGSVVFGHIHRCELAWGIMNLYGKRTRVFGMSPGTLSRVDGAVPAVQTRNNWTQGVGLLHIPHDESEEIRPELIPVFDGKLYHNGMVFEGSPARVQDIASAIAQSSGDYILT